MRIFYFMIICISVAVFSCKKKKFDPGNLSAVAAEFEAIKVTEQKLVKKEK